MLLVCIPRAASASLDLGRELARRWLGDAQAVQFRQVRSDTAIEHLQAGDVDVVIAALTHTQDWEAGADFSLPYFMDGQALLVRGADAAAIGGPMSLEGRPVGVVAWEEAGDALEAAVPFTLTLQPYDRFDATVAALGRGEIDAVADLRRRLFWGQRILPETAIVGQYTAVPVAIAFPQDDPFFADLVNLTFQEIVSDGTYAELYTRWFAPELPPPAERWPGEEVLSLADGPIVASVPDTIAAIQSRGRLAVALMPDRFPFAYVDAAGSLAGYEVSMVRLMAERWLGDPTAVDFIPVPAEMGGEMLSTGQADLLVGALALNAGLLVALIAAILDMTDPVVLAGITAGAVALLADAASTRNVFAGRQSRKPKPKNILLILLRFKVTVEISLSPWVAAG